MTNEKALATQETQLSAATMEQVVMAGDLGQLPPEARLEYYAKVCESLALNPYTQPFSYIKLNGKLTLYARRDAADQLRNNRKISVAITARDYQDDIYVVTARATTQDGRSDESTGAVGIAGLKGDALANALMKAETKAKRRVTLSIAGLGWLDETETGSSPDAHEVHVDQTTGEILESLPARQPQPAPSDPAITQPQRRRLFALMKQHGVNEDTLKAHLESAHGRAGTKDLTRSEYDAVCAWVEQGGVARTVTEPPESDAPSTPPEADDVPTTSDELVARAISEFGYADEDAVVKMLNLFDSHELDTPAKLSKAWRDLESLR